ncbi:hypothetical protein AGMMS49975_19070 [Clostridia bacterium]|nr:hypothetical protein AGMMS49975_19010 [Clostridia bacterium]GHU56194.1 hypothetical protein AGMMS49975_19070 [Clostridia bacterium]
MANYSNLPNLNGVQNGDVVICDYSGAAVNLSLPPGLYRLKCYGGQGGYRSNITYGGQGGYAEGILTLTSEISTWLYVGGSGNTGGQNGGFNGGGERESNLPGGGGATDIRLVSDNLLTRVIVAGGGGSDGAGNKHGGHGGGVAGVGRGESYGSGGGGVSQTTGGVGGIATLNGSFGQGGAGVYYAGGHGGAGGGGWYGGGGAYPDSSADDDRGGGGGSGYVLTANSVKPTGYLLGKDFYLTETLMSQGSREGNGQIVIEIINIGNLKFLACDEVGIKYYIPSFQDKIIDTDIGTVGNWVYSSGAYNSAHLPSNYFDGVLSGNGGASANPSGDTFTITLPTPQNIAQIGVVPRPDFETRLANAAFSASVDGQNWVEIAKWENETYIGATWYWKETNDPTPYNFVRLSGNQYLNVVEIAFKTIIFAPEQPDNADTWIYVSDTLTEELFLEYGIDELPDSINGLIGEAEILAWTDRANIIENLGNFTLKLTANVTAPTQTITQTTPFELPENAVVSSISLVKDEQNGGAVDVDYVAENGEICLTYTLEKPSEAAIAGIKKINVMFGEATE